MSRFDALASSGSQSWEYTNHGPPQNPASWWGHCHAWCGACVWERQPTFAKDVAGQTFRLRDRKGLMTEAYYYSATDYNTPELERNLPSPGWLWLKMRNEIRGDSPMHGHAMALIGNLTPNPGEIWNFPIYKYQVDYTYDSFWGTYYGTITLWCAADGSPSYADSTTLYDRSPLFVYTFSDVHFDTGSNPTDSGRWSDWPLNNDPNKHPTYIWRPFKAPTWTYYCANTELDEAHLSEILSCSPGTPTGVSASDGSYCDYVHITWNSVSGATGYEFYRDGALAASPSGTSQDDYPGNSSSHTYKVKAKNDCGTSGFSASDTGYAKKIPPAPTGLTASDGTQCDFVHVAWNASSGADTYNVYKDGTLVASSLLGLSYDDAVTDTSTHAYTAKAHNTCGTSATSSSDSGWAPRSAATVQSVSASDGTYSGFIRVTWTAAARATAYQIRRDYSIVGQTSNLSYDDSVSDTGQHRYQVYSTSGVCGWAADSGVYDYGYAAPAANPSVTIQTSPTGLSFSVDGTTYTSPQTFTWTSGSSHTIATTSPQSGGTGTQYVWSNWSDSGAISHTITPTTSGTYTANFATQYLLTMIAGTGGTVAPATGWQNSGASVGISATPTTGYVFSSWAGTGSGSYSGGSSSASVTMNAPISEAATFTTTTCTYALAPVGTNITASALAGSFMVTAAAGCGWTATTTNGWLHTATTGSGNGAVSFTADANANTSARSGSIAVQNQLFTVNQAGTSPPTGSVLAKATLYYDCNQTAGSQVVDSKGSNNGTLDEPANVFFNYSSDLGRYCVRKLDSTTAGITPAVPPITNATFTISCWARQIPQGGQLYGQFFMMNRGYYDAEKTYGIRNGEIMYQYSIPPWPQRIATYTRTGGWQHHVWVNQDNGDGTANLRMYVDGVKLYDGQLAANEYSPIVGAHQKFLVQRPWSMLYYSFIGEICGIAAFDNVALSDAEVAQLWQETDPTPTAVIQADAPSGSRSGGDYTLDWRNLVMTLNGTNLQYSLDLRSSIPSCSGCIAQYLLVFDNHVLTCLYSGAANVSWQTFSGSAPLTPDLLSQSHIIEIGSSLNYTCPLAQQDIEQGRSMRAILGLFRPLHGGATGAVRVDLSPAGAVSAGAQWKLDQGPWQPPGTALPAVPVGPHAIHFQALATWNTPPSAAVFVDPAQTNTLAATYVPTGGLFTEDFQSYALNSWPSANWTADANALSSPGNNRVEYSPTGGTNKVLKIFGSVGGCWSAMSFRSCSFPTNFFLECDVYNGSETLTGCRPDRAWISMRNGASWGNPGRWLLAFQGTGNIGGSGLTLASYQTSRWYHVLINYGRSGTNLTVGYWMNGAWAGQAALTVDNLSQEQSLDHVELTVQEGSAYFDNLSIYTACPRAPCDSDGCGLPDWWKLSFFGKITSVDPSADPDHDGMSNLQEYCAGTDPADANSTLRAESIQLSGGATSIRFQTAVGKRYAVEYSDSLSSLNWMPLFADSITGDGSENQLTVPPSPTSGARFYRLRVLNW